MQKDKDVFKKINIITSRKSFPIIPDLEEKIGSANFVHATDSDKANALGRHFNKVHSDSSLLGDRCFVEATNNEVKNEYNVSEFGSRALIKTFSETNLNYGSDSSFICDNIKTSEEIKIIIKCLKRKKSFGFDGISGYILKKLPPDFQLP